MYDTYCFLWFFWVYYVFEGKSYPQMLKPTMTMMMVYNLTIINSVNISKMRFVILFVELPTENCVYFQIVFICLFIYLFACLFIHLLIYLFIHLFICFSSKCAIVPATLDEYNCKMSKYIKSVIITVELYMKF